MPQVGEIYAHPGVKEAGGHLGRLEVTGSHPSAAIWTTRALGPQMAFEVSRGNASEEYTDLEILTQLTRCSVQPGQRWVRKPDVQAPVRAFTTSRIARYHEACGYLWLLRNQERDPAYGQLLQHELDESVILDWFERTSEAREQIYNGNCPLCQSEALVLFNSAECTKPGCRNYPPAATP